MDGWSMAGVMTGRCETAREEVFVDVMNEGIMTRRGQWKFVLNAALSGGKMVRKLEELYDLANDPGEMVNLAFDREHTERVASLKQSIFGWLDDSGHPYADQIRQAAERPRPDGEANGPVIVARNRPPTWREGL